MVADALHITLMTVPDAHIHRQTINVRSGGLAIIMDEPLHTITESGVDFDVGGDGDDT